MPVIKSAIKKLKQDKKTEKANDEFRHALKIALSVAKKQKSAKSVKSAVSLLDKAVKKNIIHQNKANRLKSKISKFAKTEPKKKIETVKKAPKKVTRTKTSKPASK